MQHLDVTKIPPRILRVLTTELGIPAPELRHYSPREAFDKYCRYNGIIGYGDDLFDAVTALIAATE